MNKELKIFFRILAIISLIGFIGIFFDYALEKPFISDNMTPIFLVIGGVGMLILGKVVQFPKYIKDGIQSNEYYLVLSLITGLSSVIIGILLLFNYSLPPTIKGWVGFIAVIPAVFIGIDLLKREKII